MKAIAGRPQDDSPDPSFKFLECEKRLVYPVLSKHIVVCKRQAMNNMVKKKILYAQKAIAAQGGK